MSINIGNDGQRSVQVEVEVPGTPEQVWEAIATGPGISSWFVPTTVDECEGGTMVADFGMGMESSSTISQWNPPHSYRKDSDGMDPEAPPVATEWTVEAKSGGTCVVRVVHSWFASTDEWDGQWESVEKGWPAFFTVLRLKLQHFPGQPSAGFEVSGMTNGNESGAWATLAGPLGVAEATVGQQVRSGSDCPELAGRVEATASGEAMLLVDVPTFGICQLTAMPWGEQTYLSIRLYLFGENAEMVATKAKSDWKNWFAERF